MPGDHRYTAVESRIPTEIVLRTTEHYAEAGGVIHTAAGDPYRTHDDDEDPVVATFAELLSPEEMNHVVEQAKPKMRRAGVTTDSGTGGRQSEGRCLAQNHKSPTRQPGCGAVCVCVCVRMSWCTDLQSRVVQDQ